MKIRSAYSLVELMVVMAIFAILLATGFGGLTTLRETSKVRRISNDLKTELDTYQNRATNSVYNPSELTSLLNQANVSCAQINSNDFAPDAIGIYVQDGDYSYIKCIESDSSIVDYCCKKDTSGYEVVSLADTNIKVGTSADCNGVLFEYATGDISSFQTDNVGSLSIFDNSCTFRVSHANLPFNKEIILDAENNTIEYK